MQNPLNDYYFLATLIPPIKLGERIELPYSELKLLLSLNLAQKEMHQVELLRRYYDIQNMRNIWLGNSVEPYGNYAQEELEEALIAERGFPDYINQFLKNFPETKDRLFYFSKLMNDYYKETLRGAKGFLRRYMKFEREWHLVMVALRARTLDRNLAAELQFEDPEDPFVAQILAEKDSTPYAVPEPYLRLKVLYDKYVDYPLDLHQALVGYSFDYVEEYLELDAFSFDRIMGSLIETILAEKWLALDRERGEKILSTLLEGVS